MTGALDAGQTRAAFAELPEAASHGEAPLPEQVYLPRSHLKAVHPNSLLVTGMRGAGKTFWWAALQNVAVRRLLARHVDPSSFSDADEVRTGFGVIPAPEEYPSKDGLQRLLANDVEPRMIWRTVHAWQLAPDRHPLRQQRTWLDRVTHVLDNPDAIDRLFQERDLEFDRKRAYFIILFDALDRCADDWQHMHRAIRGLLQAALDMRSYRRLRAKVFLRSDQVDGRITTDFADSSKIIASAVELSWPRRELYGLLWHHLANGHNGALFRDFLGGSWSSVEAGERSLHTVPRVIVKEDQQRAKFHQLVGPWMGRGPKRGAPYTWIPNHLGDSEGRVSPRSFLVALRNAAGDTADEYPDHHFALHYDSIKRGVQEASKLRVSELREDYPWVDEVMTPLSGMVVPCTFSEISERWHVEGVLDRVREDAEQREVKLRPGHLDEGPEGVRTDLESLGVFSRLLDGRVNIPDVFRVGYGLGRKGGVRPIR